ncbi:nucleoside triphosphate pyrophosphohydrolase [Desulfuromonas versatilis]|uniref:Nucleoside triphosphate pyrophosphohydrolase n=1 Tax=Desulfuromonas versatilis TaxID=2802975 RepID=A0ABM8HS27_9BACT|nr:nucleoside triphosphate pyrophosphohydrolase [Desulfuromonas versatilis]BCR04751.1 nucleoside triphosphate pyrophosphohydrolase [Desulfuromonas versatilis]
MKNDRSGIEVKHLLEIMSRLRSPGGCPWDAAQTPESLKPFIVEEAYEVLEAIDRGDSRAIRDELGDLLLQIIFQARIFEERGEFDFADVAKAISTKLIRRHPHVFEEDHSCDPEDLLLQWDRIKAGERERQGEPSGPLAGIPRQLPALQRSQKLLEKVARVGFAWADVTGAREKVREELEEFTEARREMDLAAMEREFGDLLFALANLGRFLGIDAEQSLRGSMNRFEHRLRHIEKTLAHQGRNIEETPREALEGLWREAKAQEGRSAPAK